MTPPKPLAPVSPRYDLYGPIHKALRAFMSDTLTRVGCFDVDDEAESRTTLAQLHRLIDICRLHLDDENRFVHPAIERVQPNGSERIAAEHDDHVAHLDQLAGLASHLEYQRGAGRHAGQRILYQQLALFVADNFTHMNVEETTHMATLWHAYDDDQLAGIEQAIVNSLEPAIVAEMMQWMFPAITHAERVNILANVRATAPVAAFEGMLELARTSLDARQFAKLERCLMPEMLQAA